MAIEKGLYAAPQGIADINNEDTPDMEITIEDPESVEIGVDGKPILKIEKGADEEGFDDNLAEYMSEDELTQLSGDLVGDFEEEPWKMVCVWSWFEFGEW